jgi:hypothetical protein
VAVPSLLSVEAGRAEHARKRPSALSGLRSLPGRAWLVRGVVAHTARIARTLVATASTSTEPVVSTEISSLIPMGRE